MDVTVQLALIVAIPAGIAAVVPILLNWLNNRANRQQKADEAAARSREKQEDWRRQDEVAAKLLAQQAIIEARAAEALEVAKATATKIDGMLVDRDKANYAEGEKKEAARGKEIADQLAEGQRQGREEERASRESLTPADNKAPLPVADDRTATASERVADASERTASATERATDLKK